MHNQKKKKNRSKQKPYNNVIITVYVESTTIQRQKPNRRRGTKNSLQWKPPTSTPGYDRKAQLLAYSQHLRSVANSQQNQRPRDKRNLKGKSQKSCSNLRVRIRRLFRPLRRPWRYEQITSEEKMEEGRLPRGERSSNKAESERCSYSCHGRLKRVLEELSCCWKCSSE
ncbi:uncharacterized protein LOC131236477 [Magnolia sinica]|uniref:uncharacterized protein LOC131236477 n=1 Tax=Magnolia sinica TaxID=86752 RepID=UPI00265B559A|nr:uncharacterized protein LOC131236477 [Magnolia sinica]